MLQYKEQPIVKIMGLLYIRFGLEPAEQWEYFEMCLKDTTSVKVKNNSEEKVYVTIIFALFILLLNRTVAEFVANIVKDHKALGTMFPRIPVNIQKEWMTKITEWEKTQEKPIKKLNERKRRRTPPPSSQAKVQKTGGEKEEDEEEDETLKSSFERSPSPEGASAADRFAEKAPSQMSAEQSSKVRQAYVNASNASSVSCFF